MKQRLARRHYERGRQFELQERFDEAASAFEAACALEPDFADPYFALGRLHAMRDEFKAALRRLDAAIDLEPEDAQLFEWRGYVRGRLHRFEEAIGDYEEARALGAHQVLVNLARMYLALGRYDEAEAALEGTEESEAMVLRDAMPRYREFDRLRERLDDARAVRYLFGATLLLGTRGDGGLRVASSSYVQLSERHVAITLNRFVALSRRMGWCFDGVVGVGPHHGPVANALSTLLDVPVVERPGPGARILLASAVIDGMKEAVALRRRCSKARLLHFCLGYIPVGEPCLEEPEIIGFAGRCAVFWHRVQPWSRMVPDRDSTDWSRFVVGPAFVNPNVDAVTKALLDACFAHTGEDVNGARILNYYVGEHRQVRAFSWAEESET